jgi:hypothetical protein
MRCYHFVETAFGYAAVAFSVEPFRLLETRLPRTDINLLCQPFDERSWQIVIFHS